LKGSEIPAIRITDSKAGIIRNSMPLAGTGNFIKFEGPKTSKIRLYNNFDFNSTKGLAISAEVDKKEILVKE
jgi:hypothetical protein